MSYGSEGIRQSSGSIMPKEGADPRISELANDITKDIDIVNASSAIKILGEVDAQLFEGFRGYATMRDHLSSIAELSTNIAHAVTHTHGTVILSGSGTSGRLASFIARSFNTKCQQLGLKPSFSYLCAGGDAALLRAQESAEDSSDAAVNELQHIMMRVQQKNCINDLDHSIPVVLIGISCGMSATYSGAQTHWLNQQRRTTSTASCWSSVLLGFNPLGGIRSVPISGWDYTFRDVIAELLETRNNSKQQFGEEIQFLPQVINPIIGPEAIAGSTRMKGGSATKIILEIAIIRALRQCVTRSSTSDNDDTLQLQIRLELGAILEKYQAVTNSVYTTSSIEGLARIAEKAGETLRNGRRVFYLGQDSAGVIGLIDASECPPTYGANPKDVCAYLANGYDCLGSALSGQLFRSQGGTADDTVSLPDWTHYDWDAFTLYELEKIQPHDLVVYLKIATGENPAATTIEDDVAIILKQVEEKHASTAYICICDENACKEEQCTLESTSSFKHMNAIVCLSQMTEQITDNCKIACYAEFALKLSVNAVSTIAHVLKGCVYQNRMIDLAVTNAKLFARSTHIIQTLTNVSFEMAQTSLLRSIYMTDILTPEQSDLTKESVPKHIATAAKRRKVVPLALLLCSMSTGTHPEDLASVKSATTELDKEPVLRVLLSNAFDKKKTSSK